MRSQMDKIAFSYEDGAGTVEFYIVDQTRISGVNYLLVADSLDEDGTALILEDKAPEESAESLYEVVEDEEKLAAIAKVFEESIGDITFTED